MAMNGNNKIATEKQKLIQEKCLTILTNMLKDDDNKYCVDCDAKGPRWASWNLGVFLCIRCAGIHRNLGVHISKVKSVNLDTWKPEQAVSLQQMGNSRARAVYEANLPDNFRRPQTDSALESFIRAKYEHNKYTAREWVAPRLPTVNWDAEIEAAMKEHRSARKSGRGRVEGPAPLLSKPQSAPASISKPPAAAAATAAQSRDKAKPTKPPPPAAAAAAAVPPASAAADLLGLETPAPGGSNADLFGDFLGAAPVSEAAPPAAPAAANSSADPQLASDEANFFSQPAPAASSAAGSVLSRDSIMALYGQGGSGASAGGGGGMAGFSSLPAASGPVGGYAGMPAATTVGGFPSMPATSAVSGFPSMPAASTVGGFPPQQQPASYPSAQGFSMGYPAAQQQQFAGLQQQIGAFQSAPYQQQQQQPYTAGAAFGQSFPGAQPTSAASQHGFPPQLHQQMAGLAMGHPQMAAPAAGFPPMGAAPPMGGQLWQ